MRQHLPSRRPVLLPAARALACRVLFAGVLPGLLALAGCDSNKTPSTSRQKPAVAQSDELDRPPSATAQIVATIDGQRIYDVDVARHAGAFGLTARAALDELVSFELLAQEAVRRGMLADPEVREATKRESVRRLIKKDFEPTFSRPEDVPDDYVDQAWGQYPVYMYFNHERYHTVSYVRLPLPRGAPPADEAKSKRNAEELYRHAVAARPKDKTEFLAAAEAAATAGGFLIEQSLKDIATTRKGRTVEEFAAAAFTLENLGDISKPARSQWGYDVLFLIDIMPERKATKAEAKPEVQKNIFETARRDVFARWLGERMASANIVKREELLSSIVVDSPLAGVQ